MIPMILDACEHYNMWQSGGYTWTRHCIARHNNRCFSNVFECCRLQEWSCASCASCWTLLNRCPSFEKHANVKSSIEAGWMTVHRAARAQTEHLRKLSYNLAWKISIALITAVNSGLYWCTVAEQCCFTLIDNSIIVFGSALNVSDQN